MKRKTISILLMILFFVLLPIIATVTVPPRRLMAYHIQQFALVPVCAFLAALPGVPVRWFAYFAAIAVTPQIAMFAYHIRGTSSHLGWDNGLTGIIIPVLIIVAVVTASTVSAWLRQNIQTGIERHTGNANKTNGH
jgi:hypothetical protein